MGEYRWTSSLGQYINCSHTFLLDHKAKKLNYFKVENVADLSSYYSAKNATFPGLNNAVTPGPMKGLRIRASRSYNGPHFSVCSIVIDARDIEYKHDFK